MVVPIVVDVDDSVEFRIFGHMKLAVALDTLAKGLPGILFHLDVEELSGNKMENNRVSLGFSPSQDIFLPGGAKYLPRCQTCNLGGDNF